jgi:hypothetical protein
MPEREHAHWNLGARQSYMLDIISRLYDSMPADAPF